MARNAMGAKLADPKKCIHEWQTVSMVFEIQLLDDRGRVSVKQPHNETGKVYLVCLICSQHTYMETNFVGYRLDGSQDRGFSYQPNNSAPYSTNGGRTWTEEKPKKSRKVD